MITYFENIALKTANITACFLHKLKIKPIQVTVVRFLIAAPVSLYFFSRGNYADNIIGLFIYIFLALFDWVDGILARLYRMGDRTKPLGRFIDHTLDRILVLCVLGSICYAGTHSFQARTWTILTIVFYSVYFFLTVLIYEFDKLFGVEFSRYPEIEKKARNMKPIDKLLFQLINVQYNSVTKFCFTISYPLFVGIITNRVILVFVFISIMNFVRSLGIIYIIYITLSQNKNASNLITVLRKLQSRKYFFRD